MSIFFQTRHFLQLAHLGFVPSQVQKIDNCVSCEMGSPHGVKWTMLGPPKMFCLCNDCDTNNAVGKLELMNYSHSISHEFTLLSDQSVLQCYFSVAPFGCASDPSRTSDSLEVRNQAIFGARREKGEIVRNLEQGRTAWVGRVCKCACMHLWMYVMYVCMLCNVM